MVKNQKHFEALMRKFLRSVQNNEVFEYWSQDQMDAIAECIDLEFVTGISYERMAANNVVFDISDPRIKRQGLKFLDDGKLHRKVNISFIFSVAAIIISILANFTEITSAIKLIASTISGS